MTAWRRSSYCGSGQCVQVAQDGGRVLVRDSREDASPVLAFSPDAWRRFVEHVR